ncbi:MAG TPA: UDP-glucose/GDP-mannose dehydrogenase family protein [Syntrophales bacterium]|nr:UDP-glucose/GDP-mannose dehydrogenase family protein [Syntrophales bacterium]
MNISIFGLGYVGCVSLGCLAKNGHRVIGVDLSGIKINFINEGKSPIVESEIDDIISEQYKLGNISATDNVLHAVKNTDVSFICVGTPSTPNGHLDLSAIYRVSEEIGRGIKEKKDFHIVVIRSTVLPGTNEKVSEIIKEVSKKEINKEFAVVSNPEFLREGTAVRDYYNPSFTLIGTNNEKAAGKMKQIYKEIGSPIIITDIKIAEIIKYVNNAFHAVKIVFANEIGNICKKQGIDAHKVMDIFCMDTKLNLSPYYFKPGFAYGGSCLPKDLKALRTIAHDYYLECPLLENIERSNEFQIKLVCDQLIQFDKEKIGFLGLSFKSGTDDLRSSPIIDIIEQLLGKGFDVKIYDKNVHFAHLLGANREFILKKIPYIYKFITDDPDELIQNADVITVVNKEREFKDILNKISEDKIIYDLVNIDFENKGKMKNYIGISW